MPSQLDLTGHKISDTYERVVQIHEDNFFDGFGRPISFGNPNVITLPAGENINIGKCVYVGDNGKVFVYRSDDSDLLGKFLGIATTSGLVDDVISITTGGMYVDSGFGYDPGAIYFVGANGNLVTVPASTGFVQQVAIGIDFDTIRIEKNLGYILY